MGLRRQTVRAPAFHPLQHAARTCSGRCPGISEVGLILCAWSFLFSFWIIVHLFALPSFLLLLDFF